MCGFPLGSRAMRVADPFLKTPSCLVLGVMHGKSESDKGK